MVTFYLVRQLGAGIRMENSVALGRSSVWIVSMMSPVLPRNKSMRHLTIDAPACVRERCAP